MDKLFQILAAILALVAIYFFWVENRDYMFISAVLGCVAFFFSVRFQVKERNSLRDQQAAVDNGDDTSDV